MSGMRRNYAYSLLALAIIIVIGAAFLIHQSGNVSEAKTNENLNIKLVDVDKTMKVFYELHKKVEVVKVVEEVKVEVKRPTIPNIPLSDEVLDYIWKKSLDSDFSYELLLAFAKVESDFNQNLTSRTRDHGMFQIHSGTDKFIAKQLGLTRFNLIDVYTNTNFAVYYLTYLREQYRSQGMSEEEVFPYTIVSFNRGIRGANNYIAKHGENILYLKKIKFYKEQFERTEV
jgi:uncharacterized protein YlaN (UPF0358 family)